MKVTKLQAQENRERIIKTASMLFHERSCNCVGINGGVILSPSIKSKEH